MSEKTMSVQELREALATNGYNPVELADMKKPQLLELYSGISSAKELLDAVVVNETGTIPTEDTGEAKEIQVAPNPTDFAWTNFVLEQFDRSEMENGSPKADGLRRVAERLLGPFNIRTQVVQAPTMETGATVVVTLEFASGRVVDGAADVSSVNTAREYAMHSVATAETRAEGRALRKALRLSKVLTAEELAGAEPDEPNGTDGRIPTSMVASLKLMCSKSGVDLERLAFVEWKADRPEDLTIEQGRRVATILSEFKRGEREIPDEIKSF